MRLRISPRLLTLAGVLAACGVIAIPAAASAHQRHHRGTRHESAHRGKHHASAHRGTRHGSVHRGTLQTSATGFSAQVLVNASTITHPLGAGTEPISQPDDITSLSGNIFVGFQNGVGAQGQASSSGNLDSTIVEFSRSGQEIAQWDVVGKCDGLTADPQTGELIATVNEDANSSVYLIDPTPGSTPVHYTYSEPLPHAGGTDAISVYHGAVLISASAPGTTGAAAPQPTYPAVYVVRFHRSTQIAQVFPLFGDEAQADVANTNAANFKAPVNLALTDPDSSEVVPAYADRFGGDFMLNSQGDDEQIFFGGWQRPLKVLKLTASIDDTAWPSDPNGVLYTTDNSANAIIAVTGPFVRGSEIAAVTPCNDNLAPATCPAPGFPANYLGSVDPGTGTITQLTVGGVSFAPQGMLFLPAH